MPSATAANARCFNTTQVTFSTFAMDLYGIDGPNMSRSPVEVTHSGSPNNYKEFLACASVDSGEVTLTVAFDPDDDITGAMLFGAGVDTLTINWAPDSNQTTGASWTASAFVTGFSPSGDIDNRLTASVTFKITGKPTIAAGS